MRLYKFCVVSLILSTVSLTACGTKTDTRPDIFNTLSQSEFLTTSAAEAKCEKIADYPAAQYQLICFQFNTVTIQSVDEAGEVGLNLGMNTQGLFKDSDWKATFDDPSRFHFLKSVENGCTDKLFFVFSGIDKLTSDDGDFPMQFAPLLSFAKLRQPECAAQ